MTDLSWAGVISMIVIAVITGKYALAGHRQQARTALRAAQITDQASSGRLALDTALNSQARLDVLEEWEADVLEWWNEKHRPRDEIVEDALRSVAPAAFLKLPPNDSMPRPRRRVPPRMILPPT